MHITLYRRSYAASGAPVCLSFAPDPAGQHHTYTADGKVYEARRREVTVTVPDSAKLDPTRNVLCWTGAGGLIRSTAREVFDLAAAGERGFGLGDKVSGRRR